MVHIREKIQENENYKKIYVTDIMSDKISDWTHHIIYFDKAPGDPEL
jgi:hypothetical protein